LEEIILKKSLEYYNLKLRMSINKELFDEGIISFDIFDKINKKLYKKMSDEK